jgi:hypothetical protein
MLDCDFNDDHSQHGAQPRHVLKMYTPKVRTAAFAGGQCVMSRFLSNFDVISVCLESVSGAKHTLLPVASQRIYKHLFGKPCSSMQSRHPAKRKLFFLVLSLIELEVQKLKTREETQLELFSCTVS